MNSEAVGLFQSKYTGICLLLHDLVVLTVGHLDSQLMVISTLPASGLLWLDRY
jgi:hypothetical protein